MSAERLRRSFTRAKWRNRIWVIAFAIVVLAVGLVSVPRSARANEPNATRLTVTPNALSFSIPLAPTTITAQVQYQTAMTATSGSCATVTPLNVPAHKLGTSSTYVATFTVTPVGVAGTCTFTVTDKKGSVQVPVDVQLPRSDLYFVAHQDDDLLFMNPDIQHRIDAGDLVTTVDVTTGVCPDNPDFGATREAGSMEAYAEMAGVANDWTVIDQPIREVQLKARPSVRLVFMRLPAGASEEGGTCSGATTSLRGLWLDGANDPTFSIVSGYAPTFGASYTRQQLIDTLAQLMDRFHPVLIGSLDNTGLYGQGADPSGVKVQYSNFGCYYYDHSDHYYSATFVAAARDQYQYPNQYLRYRGYSVTDDPINVSAADAARKAAAFAAYGEHDTSVMNPTPPPEFNYAYPLWIDRQEEVSTSPGHSYPTCT